MYYMNYLFDSYLLVVSLYPRAPLRFLQSQPDTTVLALPKVNL